MKKYQLQMHFKNLRPGVVAHIFNPSTQEAESGEFLSSRPAWSTEGVPGQPELHRETLSRKTKTKKRRVHQILLQMVVSHCVVAGN